MAIAATGSATQQRSLRRAVTRAGDSTERRVAAVVLARLPVESGDGR